MNFLKNLGAWMQFVPALIAAVKMIEEVAPIPQKGKAKLDLVLNLVAEFYAHFGAAKDAPPIEKVQALVTASTSTVVGFLNGVGAFKSTAPCGPETTTHVPAALPHVG